ncbi:hypothetical protein Daus18300_009588 [Diaporthe australafricana]|uniref:Fungal N-terminal domain-containing protein n=1 Tax=Diaporthe australafricana TaxID=127596 RepID=A0ABR3WE94_9PEZI
MAEVVGLAASIIAIAGLTKTVLELVKESKHFIKDMRNLTEDTKRSMGSIGFAAGTIQTALAALSEYSTASGTETQSVVIQFIEHEDIASFLTSESKSLILHVNDLRAGTSGLREKWWLPVATIIWRYTIKGQIGDLEEHMKFIQVSLTTLLCSVLLEIALKRQTKNEAEMQVELSA